MRILALATLVWLGVMAWARLGGGLRVAPPQAGIWSAEVTAAAAATDLSPALIQAVMIQESGGNPGAISSAGARGLMQLMPSTAQSLGVSDVNNPMQNLMGGAKYLAQLIQQYQIQYHSCLLQPAGSAPRMCLDPLVLALAAYNAGPAAVAKYGGIPPYTQTRKYVAAVLRNYAANLQAEAAAASAPQTGQTGQTGQTRR
ncbi:MAG TPA: lytic transglycosylase domain-containing protein [Bacillota bacterium]|nr:lytic transglycosylase domain-containing protein [Bacillota bacterium]